MRTPNDAFLGHRERANRKGIEFCFTFREWVSWWHANLGPSWFAKRGRQRDQYVMARNGDKGPYAPWNVQCKTAYENCKETASNLGRYGAGHPRARLTEAEALQIKHSTDSYMLVAKRFGVSTATVTQIRNGTRWKCLEKR